MLNAIKASWVVGLSVAGVFGALSAEAIAAIAHFDSLPEGIVGETLTDGGITFFDLDQGLDDIPQFAIESAAPELFDAAFSAPNYLSFGSFAEGPEFGFGRFGSTRITTGTPATGASLDVYSLLFDASNNALTLEALLEDTVVASSSFSLAEFEPIGEFGLVRQTLAISDVTFDELRLAASGPDDEGTVFIGIDNVEIAAASVPEPALSTGIMAIALLGLGRKHQ